jgi:hypothetical protein
MSEGPQDAQEWTLRKLGLADMVDYFATSIGFGVSKHEGLFGRVLERLEIRPDVRLFVGENWERDVVPAVKVGILGVHYAEQEKKKETVDCGGEMLKSGSLRLLEGFPPGKSFAAYPSHAMFAPSLGHREPFLKNAFLTRHGE